MKQIIHRRIEDKLEAKGMKTETVFLRCENAPSTKKVQLVFPAWCIFVHGSMETNVWGQSQLLQSRQVASCYSTCDNKRAIKFLHTSVNVL